jgi:imidazolonepropionase-like amidohydrolase
MTVVVLTPPVATQDVSLVVAGEVDGTPVLLRSSRRGEAIAMCALLTVRAAVATCLVVAGACVKTPGTSEPRTATAETVAFVGVNVIPVSDGDTILLDRTVVVRNDRIAAIGLASEVDVPRNAHRIDARGKYLVPGLVDAHVHLEHFDDPSILAVFLANGVTTVRNLDGRPFILDWRRRTASGHLLGPTIYTAGPILDGDPPILDDNTSIHTAADARAAVAAQDSAGYDFIKVYTNISREAYLAVVEAAKEHGLAVTGHVSRHVGVAGALEAGQHAIEHLAELDDAVEADDSPTRGRFHWTKLYLAMPMDTAKAWRIARDLAAAGVWIVPTVVQADRALPPPDSLPKWLAAPEVAHIPADGRALWEQRARRSTARMDAEDWGVVVRGRENRRRLLRFLREADVNVALGTDTPNPFVVPGFSVHEELTNFLDAGFTPRQALGAATREGARLLGESGEFGSVEVGKRADLLLLDENPLSSLATLRRPLGVMVRGRWIRADSISPK